MSDIDTAAADSLKVLDPERPIREADIAERGQNVRLLPQGDISHCNANADLGASDQQKEVTEVQFGR